MWITNEPVPRHLTVIGTSLVYDQHLIARDGARQVYWIDPSTGRVIGAGDTRLTATRAGA